MKLLMNKILSKEAKIGVIGLGYVGLPLLFQNGKAGFTSIGFDINKERVDQVNSSINYIADIPDSEFQELVEQKLLSATCDFKKLAECDVISICVPTPLDKFKQPDLSAVIQSGTVLEQYVKPGTLINLESTTYPGTTEEVLKPLLETSGLKAGSDFYLAFSPERVDPGNIKYNTANTPKIVGGITEKSTILAKAYYGQILDSPIHMVSSPKEAEMAKILENTFRVVNCALANEMAIICEKLDINIWEVIEAASTKPFGFMPFYPGPGVGGHCIPIDPFYLTYRAKAVDYRTRLIDLAGEINDFMPEYVVNRAQDILNTRAKPLNNSRILLLGVSYKADIDDLRESPALNIWKILEKKNALVTYHDPYCHSVLWNGEKKESAVLTKELLSDTDLVIITTDHRKRVPYDMVLQHANLVFDTKNVLNTLSLFENSNNIFFL